MKSPPKKTQTQFFCLVRFEEARCIDEHEEFKTVQPRGDNNIPQHALPTLKAKAVRAGAGANRTVSEGWCDLEWETNGKIERPCLWAWSSPGAKAHLSTRLTVTDRFPFLITSSLGRLNSYSQSINGTISSYLYRVAHTRFQNPC